MRVYVDGSPTKICYAFEKEKDIIASRVFELGEKVTSNQAEYLAAIKAVVDIPRMTELCSDSELMVKQLNFEYEVKHPILVGLAYAFQARANKGLKVTWIPREENHAGKILEASKATSILTRPFKLE